MTLPMPARDPSDQMVTIGISAAAFEEIRERLTERGRAHAFVGDEIDMSGVQVRRDPAPTIVMFPAFSAAIDDDRLRGHAHAVYFYLAKRLDFVRYREVKVTNIEKDAHMHERAAAKALNRLIAFGYVDRGPKCKRVWTYRLFWSIEPTLRLEIDKSA